MNGKLSSTIEGRELIALDGHGVTVRGTLHTGTLANDVATQGRIGIVFLNSLSLPRTATGDSSVFWAESFANVGYPALRMDLPGLGDSCGVIPAELLNFINAGEYASIAAAKIKEVVERFAFSGVVLVGHCAGTVTAIYAAAACATECKGLVLLDPYFHLPQAVRPMMRRGLSTWAMRSRFGGLLSNIFDRLRKVIRQLRGNSLPRNANEKLLQCWKKLATTGMPILLFKAPKRKAFGTKPRTGEFDYLSYIQEIARPGGRVVVEMVEQTDHSFANRVGRAAVSQVTEQWLQTNLPRAEKEKDAAQTTDPIAGDQVSFNDLQVDCLQG